MFFLTSSKESRSRFLNIRCPHTRDFYEKTRLLLPFTQAEIVVRSWGLLPRRDGAFRP